MLESQESLEDYDDELLSQIREIAMVPALAPLHVTTVDELSQLSPADLNRIDVGSLDTEALLFLLLSLSLYIQALTLFWKVSRYNNRRVISVRSKKSHYCWYEDD